MVYNQCTGICWILSKPCKGHLEDLPLQGDKMITIRKLLGLLWGGGNVQSTNVDP